MNISKIIGVVKLILYNMFCLGYLNLSITSSFLLYTIICNFNVKRMEKNYT